MMGKYNSNLAKLRINHLERVYATILHDASLFGAEFGARFHLSFVLLYFGFAIILRVVKVTSAPTMGNSQNTSERRNEQNQPCRVIRKRELSSNMTKFQ